MGSIPRQRETTFCAAAVACVSLPGNPLAPAAARRFMRDALADWAQRPPGDVVVGDRLADDAVLVLSELVTNA
ncbi:protein phosphatase, partial [Streptomyces sp. GXMU-J5]|nr:protein phosphatase [Streptomyces beihaiensis]